VALSGAGLSLIAFVAPAVTWRLISCAGLDLPLVDAGRVAVDLIPAVSIFSPPSIGVGIGAILL
jgi:hypothetical protein